MEEMNTLLSGIVGSTAYGLATGDSDIDRLGVFAYPTEKILGLHPGDQSVVQTNPDVTFHEAAKFISLALKCNPTVSEVLWLSDELYEIRTPLGNELISIRYSFLSAKAVRNAYFGYATSQFRRLESRGDGSFSADTRKRTAKHARHLYRLLTQGYELYAWGNLTVRLEDVERYREFGERVAAGDLEAGKGQLATFERLFDEVNSPLPAQPDEEKIEKFLLKVRRTFYN